MPPSNLRFPRLRAFCVGLWLTFVSLGAATTEPAEFDVPAGDAAHTLKIFAAQAARDIMFPAEPVAGIRTPRVRGHLPPSAALGRLLSGTVLSFTEDASTGAFIVRRAPSLPPADATPPPSTSPPRMFSKSPLRLLAAWIAGSFAAHESAHAATTPATSGIVSGYVSNSATKNLLEGARVELPEAGLVTLTDSTGRYVLSGVPTGTHELHASYLGLDAARIRVTVSAGGRAEQNFDLTTAIYRLQEFKVTGEREGAAAAITAQRNAENVKNIVAMDTFGNLPNMNPGEVAIRLPGVAGNLDNEGNVTNVMVRGMGSALNTVSIDGGMAPSEGGMSRSFPTSFISGALFDQIEVTKGLTPDKSAASMGGAIDMKTRSPLSLREKRRFTYSFSGRLAPSFTEQTPLREAHRIHPLLNASYQEVFDVFGGKRNLGVSFTLFYSENVAGFFNTLRDHQNTTTRPAFIWDYRTVDSYNNRKQGSMNARIDYRLSPATRFSLSALGNNANEPYRRVYEVRAYTNQTVGATGTAGILPGYTDRITEVRAVPASTIDVTSSTFSFYNRLRSVDLGAEHLFDRWQIDYNVRYSRAHINPASSNGGVLVNRLANVGWRLDRTGNELHPNFVQTAGPDMTDPDNYRPVTFSNRNESNNHDIKEARGNVRYRLPLAAPAFVKTGFNRRHQRAFNGSDMRRWNFIGTAALAADPSIRTFDQVKTGRAIPLWESATHMGPNGPVATTSWREDQYFREAGRYTGTRAVEETVTAGYAMTQGKLGTAGVLGRTGFLAGVRAEKTEMSSWGWVRAHSGSTAAEQQADPAGAARRDYANTRRELAGSYTKSFPSVHLTHDATSNLRARLSWSTGFGRPAMSNALPNESFNDTAQTLTINNPNLLPQMADNWDATLEYYFEPVGNLSVGWFHKSIKDFIVSGINTGTVPTGPNNGYGGEYGGYTILTAMNAGTAEVQGWEFSYQQQFTFLPGLLKNLSLLVNYTVLETRGNFGGTASLSTGQVAGFIPKTANLILSWRHRGFSSRLLVNYTGDGITSYTAASVGRNLYRAASTRMNVGFGYEVRPGVTLTCDISNLFNEPQEFYRGIPEQIQRWTHTGTTLSLGLAGRF